MCRCEREHYVCTRDKVQSTSCAVQGRDDARHYVCHSEDVERGLQLQLVSYGSATSTSRTSLKRLDGVLGQYSSTTGEVLRAPGTPMAALVRSYTVSEKRRRAPSCPVHYGMVMRGRTRLERKLKRRVTSILDIAGIDERNEQEKAASVALAPVGSQRH